MNDSHHVAQEGLVADAKCLDPWEKFARSIGLEPYDFAKTND